MIDQRALPCSGRASHADDAGLPGVRKQRFQQIRPSGRAVLDGRDGAGQRARIAGTDGINQGMSLCCQTISVKQEEKKDIRWKRAKIVNCEFIND